MRHAVILAGGGGTRLWPASRQARPKQFLPLGARPGETLLRATVRRVAGVCAPERVMIVAGAEHVAQVRQDVPELPPRAVIAEPIARNTAAALGLAAVHLRHHDPEAVLAALPADHHIEEEAAFTELAERAFAAAEATGAIVTIGIVPTRPETGYGYVKTSDRTEGGAIVVERFVEKPDRATAEAYVADASYLWNAGMFFVRAQSLLEAIAAHLPATADALDAIADALAEGGETAATEVATRVYPALAPVSIDVGVMERAERVLTLRGEFGWNDVGSWAALADYQAHDAHGNVAQATLIAHQASNNIVVADDDCAIALVGVDHLVVVKAGNAVLVMPRERAQDVRAIVEALRERGLHTYL